MKNEIILFKNQDVKLEVNLKDDTVWLIQEQIVLSFLISIGQLLQNILITILNIENQKKIVM